MAGVDVGRAARPRETGPMEGFGRSTYGDGFADVYDDWYGSLGDVEDRNDRAWTRSRVRGPLLELGVGTGRLARPLALRGRDVTGIDASAAMLAAPR